MKYALAVIVIVWLQGCSLMREAPPTTLYRIDLNVPVKSSSETQCSKKTLRVSQLMAAPWMQSNSIYYRDEKHRLYRYVFARWEQSPRSQLQQLAENSIARSGLFKGVVAYKSLIRNDWLLELRIETMMQTIVQRGQSRVDLAIDAVLVDGYSRRLIDQRAFRYHSEADADVAGAVGAWNIQSTQLADELGEWLSSVCQTRIQE